MSAVLVLTAPGLEPWRLLAGPLSQPAGSNGRTGSVPAGAGVTPVGSDAGLVQQPVPLAPVDLAGTPASLDAASVVTPEAAARPANVEAAAVAADVHDVARDGVPAGLTASEHRPSASASRDGAADRVSGNGDLSGNGDSDSHDSPVVRDAVRAAGGVAKVVGAADGRIDAEDLSAAFDRNGRRDGEPVSPVTSALSSRSGLSSAEADPDAVPTASAPPVPLEPESVRGAALSKSAFWGELAALTQGKNHITQAIIFAILAFAWATNTFGDVLWRLRDRRMVGRQHRELTAWAKSPQRTMVVTHSMSFPREILDGIIGIEYYDMRILAQILEASDPGLNVIFVTSKKVDEAIVAHLLRGHPERDQILNRVRFLHLDDSSPEPLSEKLLTPRHRGKLDQLRRMMRESPGPKMLTPFLSSTLEWELASALGIPASVYAPHPSLLYWSGKSGNRRLFRMAGLRMPDGLEDLYSVGGVARAVDALISRQPGLRRVVVKLNLGASGVGNAILDVPAGGFPPGRRQRRAAIRAALPRMRFYGGNNWENFRKMIPAKGAIVEAFLEGADSTPSAQAEILPDGTVRLLSTHEQVLQDGQVYLGAIFPADPVYRTQIQQMTLAAGKKLAEMGALGRFAVDYLTVPKDGGGHDVYAIEINLRSGGTTHPYVAAQHLARAKYDLDAGVLRRSDNGETVVYQSIDHDVRPGLTGIDVRRFLDFFERPENRHVLFDEASREGVVFHLLPAVTLKGNVGYTIIGRDKGRVSALRAELDAMLKRLQSEFRPAP